MGWREKAAKAKKDHRPSLKNWERDGLAETFPPYADAILSSTRPYRSFKVVVDGGGGGRVVERAMSLESVRDAQIRGRPGDDCDPDAMYPVVLDARLTPPREFHERYEARCVPTVIRNIPYGGGSRGGDGDATGEEKKECDGGGARTDGDEWPAVRRWGLDALAADPRLSDRPLKCGEDDDGYTIRMKLRHFLEYLRHNRDDSPLYIFDATFDEDKEAKRILEDYSVPSYFDEDLLGLVGERRRPPHRWFLVGPRRSGTTVHVDPLGTSAWNTLVHGVKRWVLFPPHVPKSVVKGRRLVLPGEDDEAIHYFTAILPRVRRRAARSGGTGDHAGFACYEFTQRAGETVFVPHGWWHAVLNVTHTVGITQNYCSRRNFDEVWVRTRSGRRKMSCTWLRRLGERHPDLAARARELNGRDGFVMWEDDPKEQERWRGKRAEKERKRRERRERQREKGEKEEKEGVATRGKGKGGKGGGGRPREQRSKKEKWGEHRTTERRKEGSTEDDGDAVMREVSPDY